MPTEATSHRRQPARGTRADNPELEKVELELGAPSPKEPFRANDDQDEEGRTEIEASNPSNCTPTEAMAPQNETRNLTAPATASPIPTLKVRRERLASVLSSNSNDAASSLKISKVQPKPFVRRNKAERDALEKAEAERQATRQERSNPSTHTRGGITGRGKVGHDGKGQLRRNKYETSQQASGPLGGGMVKEITPSTGRSTHGGRAPAAARDTYIAKVDSTPIKDSTTRVKSEPAVKPEGDRDTNENAMTGSSRRRKQATAAGSKMTKEEESLPYLSDEMEWDDDPAPRVNIEHINLVSDEEDDEPANRSEIAKGKQRENTPRMPAWQLRPVRLQRLAHVERRVGVNTDASSLTSAQLRRRAKERQNADGPLFLPEDDATDVVLGNAGGRGRGKGRDVEFVRGRKKWKGVWQGDEEDDIKVKEEPIEGGAIAFEDDAKQEGRRDSDAMSVDEEQAAAGAKARATIEGGTLPDADDNEFQSKNLEGAGHEGLREPIQRRTKIRGYRDMKSIVLADDKEPEGHEDTDFAEIIELWQRFRDDDADDNSYLAAEPNLKTAHDAHSHKYPEHKSNASRERRAYLMQLPPILPSLRDATKAMPKIKTEAKRRSKTPIPESSTNPFSSHIKPEQDIKEDPDSLSKETTFPNAYTATTLNPSPGYVGTLTMYDSGRIVADWGGTILEVHEESHRAGLAQELLLMDYESTMTKIEDQDKWDNIVKVGGDSKEACAAGSIEGSFVGMPDWDSLLC